MKHVVNIDIHFMILYFLILTLFQQQIHYPKELGGLT